jgi:hypothetical protein
MKNSMFVFAILLAFSASAMAVDIAISTQGGWMGQGHADTEAQEIVDSVTGVTIDVFTSTDHDALAEWVEEHTGDGVPDLLVMFGIFPDSIYPAGNAQTDGSLAELFLDDGNVIVNTGDYIFYVGSGGNNDAGGLANMTDVSSAAMWGDDTGNTRFTPTEDGELYTPSLPTLSSNRPWFPAQFEGTDWEFELILAQSDDGTQVHPGIIHNTRTDGRLGVFFQYSDDSQPRGEVISEWINNWYLPMLGSGRGNPYPSRPDPKNGTLHEDTWISLSWRSGSLAVSHDVYMGLSFDDVNDGAEGTFVGNQPAANVVAGFPGFAFPDGLVPGTTYYWRVEEVNEAEPNSPWSGPVWSFSIPPRTAYTPSPINGAKFIDPNADLSWTAGFGGKLHTVYFGDNFDDVNNAVGGAPQGTTTYALDTLEPEKTYYWRVDEFDAISTYKGEVWSFTVAKEGGGIRGSYYTGMNFGSHVLDRIDPQINFNWGDPGSPDESVPDDQFSARWVGEVEAAFTETYTFYTNTDDGARLWIDGQQLVDAWVDQGTTEHKGTIDLMAGNTYSVVMEYYENGGGAVAELRWSSPSTPKDLIPQAAFSLPVKASQANPSNGAVNVSQTTMLSWSAGENAVSHNVYFGTDMETVKNADTSSAEYKGSKQLDAESYDPGQLEWNVTYYWRIDEVEDGGTIQTGNVWSFTTADFLIVDDMESYNDLNTDEPGSNRIFLAWIDGFDTPTVNGSIVGYANPPFAELTIVHTGNQSMPFEYNNAVGKSEATLTLTDLRNWTQNGVDTLAVWYMGEADNTAEQMYVTLNGSARVNNSNPNAALAVEWTEWRIPLQDFTGVNLSNVNSITLGLSSVSGGTGMLYFDDIRLHVSP